MVERQSPTRAWIVNANSPINFASDSTPFISDSYKVITSVTLRIANLQTVANCRADMELRPLSGRDFKSPCVTDRPGC